MNNYKKYYERAQETINAFEELCRKRLQDNAVDEKKTDLYVTFLQNMKIKLKTILF